MYQPLIKFHPYPAIITQVLRIFANKVHRELCRVRDDVQKTFGKIHVNTEL